MGYIENVIYDPAFHGTVEAVRLYSKAQPGCYQSGTMAELILQTGSVAVDWDDASLRTLYMKGFDANTLFYDERQKVAFEQVRRKHLDCYLEVCPLGSILDKLDELMKKMGRNTFRDDGPTHIEIFSAATHTPLMKFQGHIYEPRHESFASTCCVTAWHESEEEILFDEDDRCVGAYHNEKVTTGSIEKVRDFIWLHAKEQVYVKCF